GRGGVREGRGAVSRVSCGCECCWGGASGDVVAVRAWAMGAPEPWVGRAGGLRPRGPAGVGPGLRLPGPWSRLRGTVSATSEGGGGGGGRGRGGWGCGGGGASGGGGAVGAWAGGAPGRGGGRAGGLRPRGPAGVGPGLRLPGPWSRLRGTVSATSEGGGWRSA